MGWRKRRSKAQVFQDSFPKTESTEILTTFVGNGVSESKRNSLITEPGRRNEKLERVCTKS